MFAIAQMRSNCGVMIEIATLVNGDIHYILLMKFVLNILALVLLASTAIPLLSSGQWWVRIFDFPRIQITIVGIILLAIYFYAWDTEQVHESVMLGLVGLAIGYQATKIFPYTVLMRKQVVAAEKNSEIASISLLVANVLIDNRQSEDFLGIVRKYDPDLILTVETDEWWEEALRPLEKEYPHTLKRPLGNSFGMLVHSRLELIDPEVRFILKENIPSMQMQVVLPSGDRVFIQFVHPNPPNPRYAIETTERDAELLIVGREAEKQHKPTIIAGDFNDVAWSYTTTLFQKASGLLDPRIGRGMYNTFNAKIPLLRWPLDHVFHSDHFKLVRMAVGPAWGSDHFPIFIQLSLEPGAQDEQEKPDTSRTGEKQVDEKIEDGKQQADE